MRQPDCTCCPICDGVGMTGACNHGCDEGACKPCIRRAQQQYAIIKSLATMQHLMAADAMDLANRAEALHNDITKRFSQ